MRYIISLLMISLVLAVELQAKKKHRPGDPIVTYTGEAPCVGISNPKNVATCCYGTYRQGGITHPKTSASVTGLIAPWKQEGSPIPLIRKGLRSILDYLAAQESRPNPPLNLQRTIIISFPLSSL
ncbi:hypothetical protein PSTG_16264 [Puccinia striiformis f. sp. tritici PST-78]|uniref:Secreted protein n=1 Tax=Puccinia striiformis f. sp. tritici PST-78 TaxID=1165861 RepID=A0A0L0UTM3_9BASI|nr:hypothetical protein PSTG_16264 [Puccinia striiformis f. sp. tritici PST-78]